MRINSDPANKLKKRRSQRKEEAERSRTVDSRCIGGRAYDMFLYLRDLNRPSTAPNTHVRIYVVCSVCSMNFCCGVRCVLAAIHS